MSCVCGVVFGGEFDQQAWDEVIARRTLVRRDDVRRELGLSGQQIDAIRRAGSAIREDQSRLDKDKSHLTYEDQSIALAEMLTKRHQVETASFSPEQLQRLDELRIQYQSRRASITKVMAVELALTPEEEKIIRDKEDELAAQARSLMWDYYRSCQSNLLGALDVKQRAEWRSLIGEEFTFPLSTSNGNDLGLSVMLGNTRTGAPTNPEYISQRLLNRADVDKELEITTDQHATIRSQYDRLEEITRDSARQLADAVTDDEKSLIRAETRKALEDFGKRNLELIDEALLPHQLDRLKQLDWQVRALQDFPSTLESVVRMNVEQSAKMRKKDEELQQRLATQMSDLYAKFTGELVALLPSDKRALWKEKNGEPFDFTVKSHHGSAILARLLFWP